MTADIPKIQPSDEAELMAMFRNLVEEASAGDVIFVADGVGVTAGDVARSLSDLGPLGKRYVAEVTAKMIDMISHKVPADFVRDHRISAGYQMSASRRYIAEALENAGPDDTVMLKSPDGVITLMGSVIESLSVGTEDGLNLATAMLRVSRDFIARSARRQLKVQDESDPAAAITVLNMNS